MAEDNESNEPSKGPRLPEPRPKKRGAVNPNHQACTACKRRKVRCDAAQPRCSYCAAHDKLCIFPPVWKRAKCSQAHVEDLEVKLRQYESRYGRPTPTACEAYPESQNHISTLTSQNQHSTAFTGTTTCEPPTEVQGSFAVSNWQKGASSQIEERVFDTNNTATSGDDNQQINAPWISHNLSHMPSTDATFSSRAERPETEFPHPSEETSQHRQPPHRGITNDSRGLQPTTTSGHGDDSDVDEDSEADHQIIDGMVEYVGSSPEDVQAEDTFDTSPTFNFALKIKASTLSKEPKSVSGRSEIPSLSDKPATASSTLVDRASNNSNLSTTLLRREPPPQQDALDALKFYFNHSYLQYVPQRLVAKALLDRYFAAANSVWPFLNEEIIRQRYDRICSSDEPPSPIRMSQLNLVFALACQFYETEAGAPLPDVYDAGKQYYLRGHGYLIAHAFDTCSITMLQSLLLAAQYQQGTTRSNECWLTTGHATRMALGLGVHVAPSPNSGLSPLDIELRKRLWWGCFSLDRVCSMIYGRPIGIPHVRVLSGQNSLPEPVDDNYIAMGKAQPSDCPSVNAFFVCTINLYRTMDKIIEELHQISATNKLDLNCGHHGEKQDSSYGCSCDAVRQLSAIIQLDGYLQEWHETLPPHLKFSLENIGLEDNYPRVIQRQKVILKIRFLGMRLLLHRQSILFLLQNPENRRWPRNASKKWPPLFSDDATELVAGSSRDDQGAKRINISYFEKHLAHLSAKLCVESAQLQIETIDCSRRSELTGAWWWDFHFIFNALCVLCGAMGLRTEDHSVVITDLPKAQTLMQRGVSNIHDMASRGGPKVARSERFLRRLMKAVTEQKHDPPIGAKQGRVSNVARDSNDQATARRLDGGNLPQVPSRTVPTDPMELFGDDVLDPMDGLDWPPNVDNAFISEITQNESYLYGNADQTYTPHSEDNPMRKLLQTSFDTWTALGGAFQPPIDMESVW